MRLSHIGCCAADTGKWNLSIGGNVLPSSLFTQFFGFGLLSMDNEPQLPVFSSIDCFYGCGSSLGNPKSTVIVIMFLVIGLFLSVLESCHSATDCKLTANFLYFYDAHIRNKDMPRIHFLFIRISHLPL